MSDNFDDLEDGDNDLIPTTEEITEPCAYCGKLDAFVERADFSSAYVFCNACSARGPVACQESDSEEEPGANEAIRQWNRRSASQALLDVAAERRRQVEAEGFTFEHDDTHTAGEMAFAAACYATSGAVDESQRGKDDRLLAVIQFIWPKSWSWGWWTPKTRRRDLVRSAALLIAEIERIDRAATEEIKNG